MGINSRISGVLLLAALLGGCGEQQGDISSDSQFAGVMGHVFETRQAMIIFGDGISGMRLGEPGRGGAPELADLPPDLPYKGYNGNIILGVLPPGSRFQVTGIEKGWSTLHGNKTDYELRMKTPDKYRGWKLSSTGLLDYGVWPMRFEKKLVQEVKWEKPI